MGGQPLRQEYDLYKQHNKLDFMHYNGSSTPQRPHNDFLWVFSEAGFFAGIGYLIFFLILIRGSYYHYLKDKSVIIVGPASYLKGTKRGGFIDSFDVVVRCNGFWKPPIEHQEDIGKKTNIRSICN